MSGRTKRPIYLSAKDWPMTDIERLPRTAELPDAIVSRDQWVCWRAEERDGKPTKIPINPHTGLYASTTDSRTWADFEHARDHAAANEDGIGFVFTRDDPLVGVDLDDCRDPASGRPDPTAKDIIRTLDSYTEVSPSEMGYHVLIEGSLPEGRNRRGAVEFYDRARFFTVTGLHVEGTPATIEDQSEALAAVHRKHVADDADEVEKSLSSGDSGALSDSKLLDHARNAKNGEKFNRLWQGNTTGYASQSEADMALCCLLAFWTGGDTTRMDRLFRGSGLMRSKWTEQHYADGSTYGEVTIQRAVDITTEFYDSGPSMGDGQPESSSSRLKDRATRASGEASYVSEQARLLKQRVRELEALLELKENRISSLEQQVEELSEPNRTPQDEAQGGAEVQSSQSQSWVGRLLRR
jgi:primase-polymerase (primpol)-like protein